MICHTVGAEIEVTVVTVVPGQRRGQVDAVKAWYFDEGRLPRKQVLKSEQVVIFCCYCWGPTVLFSTSSLKVCPQLCDTIGRSLHTWVAKPGFTGYILGVFTPIKTGCKVNRPWFFTFFWKPSPWYLHDWHVAGVSHQFPATTAALVLTPLHHYTSTSTR